MDTKTFGMNSRDCGEILKKAGYIFDYDKWSWCKDGVVLFDGSGLNWAQSTYSAYGRFLLIPAPETPASTVESPTPDSANYRLEINGESQTYLKLLSPDNRVLFSDSHGLNEHWYELITSTLNKETESLRHQLAKAQADLVAAQNIIVQAGKDFEALKADNSRYESALENIYNDTLGYEAKDSDADQDLIDRINRDTNLVLTQTQAPSPAQDVTLHEDAIEYLSHIWVGGKAVSLFHVRAPFHSIVTLTRQTPLFYEYHLHPDYDTPANHAAIEAKRKSHKSLLPFESDLS